MDSGPLYNQVGVAVAHEVGFVPNEFFLYLEVQDGVVACSLFLKEKSKLTFKFCGPETEDAVYSAWERSSIPDPWVAMAYNFSYGKFKVDLTFSDKIDFDEEQLARRKRVVKKYFGDIEVDFSNP